MDLRQGEAPLESCAWSCVNVTARTITRARERDMVKISVRESLFGEVVVCLRDVDSHPAREWSLRAWVYGRLPGQIGPVYAATSWNPEPYRLSVSLSSSGVMLVASGQSDLARTIRRALRRPCVRASLEAQRDADLAELAARVAEITGAP